MIRAPYDDGFEPPAPVLPLRLGLPGSGGSLQLAGLVDTGADITLVPEDVAEAYLPVAGTVGVRGTTGDVRQAVLYRARVAVGRVEHVLIVVGLGERTIMGRDLLARFIVRLDGPGGVVSAEG